ncbi:MAG: hypothetical protein JO000_30715 [Alphaproteobacteria bacterium]|nr:hypothetical protein [Alphaproteobacteria bacterium]
MRDGILKRTDRHPEVRKRREERKRAEPDMERIELSADRALHRIDGTWYALVDMWVTRRRLANGPVFDVARRAYIQLGPGVDNDAGWYWYRRENPDRRYAVAKRQLSRRELRRHGLENRAEDED